MSANTPGRTQFWLRKLHSLTGFIFIGYFLCLHVRGNGSYNSDFFRVAFLWIPLVFHAVYGAYICYEAQPNNLRYNGYIRNWMYMFQRATAFIIVPFLIVHMGVEQYGWSVGEWYPALWYVGVVTAVFHLTNGIFGTMIDWGITVGPHSQRVFVGISFAGFIVLCTYGIYTLNTGGYY